MTLERNVWSAPGPNRFTPGKETQNPFYRTLDGSGKSRLSPGLEIRNFQRVASPFLAPACQNKYLKYSSVSPVKYTDSFQTWCWVRMVYVELTKKFPVHFEPKLWGPPPKIPYEFAISMRDTNCSHISLNYSVILISCWPWNFAECSFTFPRTCPCFDVVVGLVLSNDSES